jgi:rhomboid protease GluP
LRAVTVAIVLPLLILAGFAVYLMTPDERVRLGRAILTFVGQALRSAIRGAPAGEPFSDFLRARTRWPLVTLALVIANVVIFVVMLFAPGSFSDPDTLVSWGANFAPRTTNDEWWRLITAMFVHSGLFHLLATLAGLLPLCLILERLVGHVVFATVYFAAGILGSLISLWTMSAVDVSAGASAGIYGAYGLLLASLIWALVNRPTPTLTIPVLTVKRAGMAAGVFVLYNVATDDIGRTSEILGLGIGFVSGLILTRGISHYKPPLKRAAIPLAATMVIAVVGAVPLRGLADIRPEIARVVATEERTASAYDAAVNQFKKGWISSEALARLINRTIVPELEAAQVRLKALRGVPREHVRIVAAAQEYFELREKAWQRRAEGLLEGNMRTLREADQTERASLQLLARLKFPDEQQ